MILGNFLCAIEVDYFCTFVWTIATEDYCMLQTIIKNVSSIDFNYIHKLITALKLVKDFLQTGIVTCRTTIAASNANITTKCLKIINYNKSSNNHTLTTA